jgi:HEAT repeat protein
MWWILGLSLLANGALVASGLRAQRRRLQLRQDIAASCGLKVVKVSSSGAIRLKVEARAGPVKVRIEDSRAQRYGLWIAITFPGPPGFSGVRMRREVFKPPGAREIEVGDELFDSRFFVEGPSRLLTVLLDAETRALLLSVNLEGELEISGSEIRLETHDKRLPDLLPLLLDITRRFTDGVDVAQRLAENARQDPEAGVRLRNLLVLAREHPGEPGTIETLRAACSDPSPQMRLRAAMALGSEGRDLLVELAESTEDDAISAQAVVAVGRELPFEHTRGILDHALRRRRLQTARSCLEALGHGGDAAAVDVLEKVLAIEKGELAAAAARALGATGSPAAEPPLLLALHSEKMDIRLAAATALGRAGSAAAVLPLKDAAESARDNELRRAIRQAIAEIQSRLEGASPGQLSLAEAEAGQLSLANAEIGRLSLSPGEAGPASAAP